MIRGEGLRIKKKEGLPHTCVVIEGSPVRRADRSPKGDYYSLATRRKLKWDTPQTVSEWTKGGQKRRDVKD